LLFVFASAARGLGSGFPSLKLGADARIAALGNAGVAWTGDASAGFRNPAGLALGRSRDFEFSMHRWFTGVKSGFLGAAFRGETSGFGCHVLYTEVGDIQYRLDAPSTDPAGEFAANELAAGVSYARLLAPGISAGVTLKWFYEKIFVDEASGLGGDIGVSYALGKNGWRVGAAVQNIGKTGKLAAESIELPFEARIGVALPVRSRFGDWLFLVDGSKDREHPVRGRAGAEFAWKAALFVRAGVQTGFETHFLSGGLGVATGRLRLDYAFTPLRKGLGDSHWATVHATW
jgi:hypothetical protein